MSIFFERVVIGRDPKIVVSWVTGELFSYLKKNDLLINESNIKPKKIGELLDLIIKGLISNRQAKEIFEEYLESELSALEFVNKKGIKQVSDKSEIVNLINSVLQENPQMVNEYRNGKRKIIWFLCGPS